MKSFDIRIRYAAENNALSIGKRNQKTGKIENEMLYGNVHNPTQIGVAVKNYVIGLNNDAEDSESEEEK